MSDDTKEPESNIRSLDWYRRNGTRHVDEVPKDIIDQATKEAKKRKLLEEEERKRQNDSVKRDHDLHKKKTSKPDQPKK